MSSGADQSSLRNRHDYAAGFESLSSAGKGMKVKASHKTVRRRFQAWCRDEILRRALTEAANELRDRGALDEEECFIDATFGQRVARQRSGMKIMAIVDRHGLPLSVSTHAANHHVY